MQATSEPLDLVGRTTPLTTEEFAALRGKYLDVEVNKYTWLESLGELHRDGDLPAKVGRTKIQWYQRGECHRDNGLPAIVRANGFMAWIVGGYEQRDGDLPTIVNSDGAQLWRNRNGILHRDNGLPAVIQLDGNVTWFTNGMKTGDQDDPPPGAVFPGQLIKSASKQ